MSSKKTSKTATVKLTPDRISFCAGIVPPSTLG
jgi:hypothetical protein